MPRPRRFSVKLTVAALLDAYRSGESPRQIAARTGLTRSIVTERLAQAGITARQPLEAMDLRHALDYERHALAAAKRCRWPGCESERDGGGLCGRHAAALEANDERACGWPRCPERGRSICYFHSKVSAGL